MQPPRVSTNRRLLSFAWPFVVAVVLLVLLGGLSQNVLSAVRAYIAGESLWSKGQKDAVYYLERYAETGSELAYQQYRDAIRVPLADSKARRALDRPDPDTAAAAVGFLQGANDPDDIPELIWLFLRFRRVSYLDQAIIYWAEGDRLLGELDQVAQRLRQGRASGALSAAQAAELKLQIQEINREVTPLEHAFSNVLAEGGRVIQRLLAAVNLVSATVLILFALLRTRQLIRQSELFEQALGESEERLALAVSGSDYGIWDWNIAEGSVYYSPRFKAMLGLAEHELEGSVGAFWAHLHPDDTVPTRDSLERHLAGEGGYDVEYRLRTRNGGYRWFRARGQALRDAAGRAVRMSGSIFDITDRKLAEGALHAEQERAQVTLASIGDAVITLDGGGQVDYLNPVAEQLIGHPLAQAHGRRLGALCCLFEEGLSPERPVRLEPLLNEAAPPGAGRNLLLERHDGSRVSVCMVSAPIFDSQGGVSGKVLVFHDMTRERLYIESLSWQASHDALTGLTNRHEFERRLTRLLETTVGRQQYHVLMYLDLDQFKVVNDTCGHAAGDELLRQVCVLLSQQLREGDTLARLGGDEFGVLLQNCPPEAALPVAEKLRQTVCDLHFSWNGQPFAISASIGVVHISGVPTTLKEVMRAADVACYMAKEKGRNRAQLYVADDAELTVRYGEMEWVQRLHRALEDDRFRLYAQTIVPLGDGSAAPHFELLLRLLDEYGMLVPPSAFIPAAERYNLMVTIDRWVVSTALAMLAARTSPGSEWTCAINLSGASLCDDDFLGFLRAELAGSGIDPAHLCFEVTETSAIANLACATEFMRELRQLGCRFSLDDFGAGMSSFGYLKHLPVDFLKIDGGFVKDMLDDPVDHAMVEVINHIGHVMGKQTIAEFAEHPGILEALKRMGVDYAQGYGVARPLPLAEVLAQHFPASAHDVVPSLAPAGGQPGCPPQHV
ncbi:diguanylate cyclase/phosphodiesterase with PAS sensor(s) [Pseudogulbenkiania sp. NH8B]|uniref:EAL domain-containing protein n=1 Tax=Pseudogulbenkiania sp. (strain NH8B) TaxID=748280 RepID=UPI000227A696|nr:EAL domain-containing protein [Pseudogulbenkiania sp. NH8B]BAK78348.1 diguanylate cyclase/phosphodiesterase with PAS sensor(s) [Pseudogulbenkiania sp. NH8B]